MTPGIRLPPAVQVVSLAEGKTKGLEEKEEREGCQDLKDRGEKEKDAMVKYVMQDLSRELYTELMEGFHK
jgi:F420-0:gamma-glutamyl ligase